MKEKIMNLLSKTSTWTKLYNALGIIATGGSTLLDPHIGGYVGTAFIALTGPVGLCTAKIIESLTSNYAQTDTKLDDIAHAASEALINK
jgi:hypothetical protein